MSSRPKRPAWARSGGTCCCSLRATNINDSDAPLSFRAKPEESYSLVRQPRSTGVTALQRNHEPQARDLHLVSQRTELRTNRGKFYWLAWPLKSGATGRRDPSGRRESADPSPAARDFNGLLLLLRERLPNEKVRFLGCARNDKGRRSRFGLNPLPKGKAVGREYSSRTTCSFLGCARNDKGEDGYCCRG